MKNVNLFPINEENKGFCQSLILELNRALDDINFHGRFKLDDDILSITALEDCPDEVMFRFAMNMIVSSWGIYNTIR